MVGDDRKRKKKKKQRPVGEPATTVVDLRLDLRGLTALAKGSDRPVVARLVMGDGPDGDPAEAASDAVTAVAGPVGPAWPLGPHYLRWVEGKKAAAWARFKLRSADWYLEALEVAEREVGLDRFVGVEMAIDGVLASLCAGVDAAAQALLDEVEGFAGPSPLQAHGPVDEDWTILVTLAEGAGIVLDSALAVQRAVRGEQDEVAGWLTELRRLRALAVRRNVLVRRPNIDDAARDRLLDVPGLGQRPALRYLRKARRRTDDLVEALLADADGLARERHRLPSRAGSSRAGLSGLSARAGLLGSRRGGSEAR